MKKLIIGTALALLSLIAVENRAHAAGGNGYVCSVRQDPFPSVLGQYGNIYVTLYSGPSCTGTYVSSNTFCSTGSNAPTQCSGYNLDQPSLISFMDNMRSAAATNERLVILTVNNLPYTVQYSPAGM